MILTKPGTITRTDRFPTSVAGTRHRSSNTAHPCRSERVRLDFRRSHVTPAYPRLRTERRRSRKRKALIAILVVGLVGGVLGAAAITTNTMGAGRLYERFIAKVDAFLAGPPPPDRPTEPTVVVTPKRTMLVRLFAPVF